MMMKIYKSFAGIVNLVFTAAVFLLAISLWGDSGLMIILLLPACLWFPVIHPYLIYQNAKKQINAIPEGMSLSFDKEGLHVKTPTDSQSIAWNQIQGISHQGKLIIIQSGGRYGYMIPTRIIGSKLGEFNQFLKLHKP